jgi:hypothetical protein
MCISDKPFELIEYFKFCKKATKATVAFHEPIERLIKAFKEKEDIYQETRDF